MTEEQVYAKLTAIFREVFEDASLVATPAMTAGDVERWDSLTHVDMVMMVEEAFGVRLPLRDIAGLKCVGDLARLLSKNT